jgi:hypothetical protein
MITGPNYPPCETAPPVRIATPFDVAYIMNHDRLRLSSYDPSMRFFVGSLSYKVKSADIGAFVSEVAENAALVVTDRDSGRSKGFGWFEVLLDRVDPAGPDIPDNLTDAANETLEELLRLHGKPIVDRDVNVTVARPKEEREPFSFRDRSWDGQSPDRVPPWDDRLSWYQVLQQEDGNETKHYTMGLGEFRDALEATQSDQLLQDSLSADAFSRVRSELGPVTFMNNRILDFLTNHRASINDLLNPRQFEELCYELLRRTGFHDLELTQQSRDGGADIHGRYRENGQESVYVVECKHWDPTNKVGSPIVQQTFGVMGLRQADKAMVVTSSFFTGPAKGCQAASQGRLLLRDRNTLGLWLSFVRNQETRGSVLWLPGE